MRQGMNLCGMALAGAASLTPRLLGVHCFRNQVPLQWRGASCSTTLSANQLEDVTSLSNQYFCLRHGQSQANVAKIIASNPDVACEKYGLSPTGREQAEKAGQEVVNHFIVQSASLDGICILTSDLLRAKETANIVAAAITEHNQLSGDQSIPFHEGQVIIETKLRERGFGEWDLTRDSNYENVWKDDAVDPSHTIKGVESVTSVMDRVSRCVLEWDSKLQNHMIICVAHGDVLQILQTCFSKLDGSKHRTLEHLETATLRGLELRQ